MKTCWRLLETQLQRTTSAKSLPIMTSMVVQRKIERRNAMLPNSHEAISLRIFCQSLNRRNDATSLSSSNNNNIQGSDNNNSRIAAAREGQQRNGNERPSAARDEEPYSSDSSTEVVRISLGQMNIDPSRPYGAPSAWELCPYLKSTIPQDPFGDDKARVHTMW